MEKIGKICFWLGFIIEAVLVMIDKSAYINPYESYLFRFTFLLFCIKIATTRMDMHDTGWDYCNALVFDK